MHAIQKIGYVLVQLPAEDVRPLFLMEKISKGMIKNLHTHIKEIFEPAGKALPSVTKNSKAPDDLKRAENVDLNNSFNFNFLNVLLRFFKGSVSADTALAKKVNMEMEMTDLRKDYVSIHELDAYIQQARMVATPGFKDKMEEGSLYVVTEILKTSRFSLDNGKKTEFKLEAEAKMPGVVESNASLTYGQDNENSMKGKGDYVIGLMAYQIISRDGRYTLKYNDSIKSSRGELFPGEKLTGEEGFITVENK